MRQKRAKVVILSLLLTMSTFLVISSASVYAAPSWTFTSPVYNDTIDVGLKPTCSVVIAVSDNTTTNITFYTNETGSWVKATNTSGVNGTYDFEYGGADSYSTKYYWKVFVMTNATTNDTITYSFTTKAEPSLAEATSELMYAIVQVVFVMSVLGLMAASIQKWGKK